MLKSSKGNYSESVNARITFFALCTLSTVGYSVDTIKKQFYDKVPREITQKA